MSFAGRRRGNKVKKGVQFTVMVVGASGTGRTTFVNTLCESEVLTHKVCDSPETAHVEEGIRIKPVNVELEEDGVRIALTIVDTPGFGDNIDNEFAFQEIVGYLERQYDDILAEESRIKRNPRFRDNRVHALLYFISPTGHALREMDIELMRRLSPRVNVIPVIGKADSLTPSELRGFKKRIMEDIEYYDIPVYNFPYDVEEDDEDTIQDNSELRGMMPFSIVGSEEEVEIDGEAVRARIYPWGIVEIDNPKHTDFSRLRGALLKRSLTMSCTKLTVLRSFPGQYTQRPRILPFSPRNSLPRACASRRSSSAGRRRSCARSSCACNARSTRRDKNCLRRKSLSGIWRADSQLKALSQSSASETLTQKLFYIHAGMPRYPQTFDRCFSRTFGVLLHIAPSFFLGFEPDNCSLSLFFSLSIKLVHENKSVRVLINFGRSSALLKMDVLFCDFRLFPVCIDSPAVLLVLFPYLMSE
ncbi:unnamed protein product [Somion occarium]|uniref:Septin-type G domain-containing protein n=1 Tax=Somion occarium TaxID=3059160 RepID=A0ABP1CN84_9APHY